MVAGPAAGMQTPLLRQMQQLEQQQQRMLQMRREQSSSQPTHPHPDGVQPPHGTPDEQSGREVPQARWWWEWVGEREGEGVDRG